MTLPVATALILFSGNSFYFLTECRLLSEVLFLLATQVVKMLLVTFVDNCRSSLEAIPHLFAQLAGTRTRLAIFLMQLLQLMEGTNNIGLVSQLLSSLAELGLQLEILLKVVFTRLAVQLQQIIELFDIQLVVTP